MEQPPPLIHQPSTLSTYAKILDDYETSRWSIRQANSRLHAHGLESALENDLVRQANEKNQDNAIPLNDLNRRQSNNPYITHQLVSSKHKTYGYADPFAIAPVEAWQEIKDYNLRVNGLPTLDQMMRLNTLSPLTQSQFSTFLKRRNAHQNLNFLVELETHEKLWRAHLGTIERQSRQRLSRFLQSLESLADSPPPSAAAATFTASSDTQDLLHPPTPKDFTYASRTPHGTGHEQSLSRHDLVQNAIRIYRTFCSALDAAQPIHLPDDHRAALDDLVEKNQRPEPVVFDSARAYVFEILNVFYYPQFVDAVLYKNVATASARALLALGLVLLTTGLSVEFGLIFSGTGTYATRWWGFLPFLLAWSSILTSLTHFAWWLAFAGISETHFMVYIHIQDKTVQRIHRKRAFLWLLLTILISLITTITFAFIPAHRLVAH
ncbi:Bud site selection protein, Revert to axial protein 1 [Apophysomyces sp. BC1034]|nr:Bud site selection protein, Revert to axial protein 1 [Apophysomyces sp. BC1015]KAG0180340.1 Bud site selection protein, Revert to axial protein 1 [Apophysomyces sp. BC1021]KAG0187761.1 Bud site selection protein, Revert to axial protein 1 [Apophysomyces sp. BC1034]